jgi:hypothetical protein
MNVIYSLALLSRESFHAKVAAQRAILIIAAGHSQGRRRHIGDLCSICNYLDCLALYTPV